MVKNLVICCDGTWDFAGQRCPTNVVRLWKAIPEVTPDGTVQEVHYVAGVGTGRGDRLTGGAFGRGLSGKVLEAYTFLVDHFQPGDRLYLFGFSRGAFTARSLAGLIRNSGILHADQKDRVKEAWALYRARDKEPGSDAAKEFRDAYAHETGIRFIGVWDTVGSLGIPVPRSRPLKPLADWINRRWAFHDTTLSARVEGAFHALAIDEKRPMFAPTLWHQQAKAVERNQVLRQVWFSGVHVDVGGAYKDDTTQSDLTLRWMVHHACAYGLHVDPAALGAKKWSHPGKVHESYTKLYRLVRPLHRPIGRAQDKDVVHGLDGCEYLSVTAADRHGPNPCTEANPYRPPELCAYLRDFGAHHVDPFT
ncbi:DUF2235 domain-containing protein [Streptomyces sp. 7R007]